jgi:mutual gliding-motility protein MglA
MALFNYANREITAKIVYYGPGVCGKTTSLQYIHERIAPVQRGRLLSLATETDRTIFFDLLPLKLGEIRGFKLRFQLYTVPGQVKYNRTRKLVLQGADAIVFVADSHPSRREANIESFRNLQENLQEQGKRLEDLPLVYSYNKRDLSELLSVEELNQDLNSRDLPHFPTVATEGVGVMETLETVSKLALQDIEQRLTAGTPETGGELAEDFSLTENELVDLTGGGDLAEETSLNFSTEELDALDLESDLDLEPRGESSLETRPIGYDTDVPVQEFEMSGEPAQTGTLKESVFFDLKNVEEQALRELDDFLGAQEDESEALSFDTFEEAVPPEKTEEELEFSFDESGGESLEGLEEDELDFSFDAGGGGFDLEQETPEEKAAGPAETDEALLDFSVEEEADMTFSLDEQEALPDETEFAPDTGAENEEELLAFSLEEEETSAPPESESADTTSLELDEGELDLGFGEDEQGMEAPLPAFALDEDDETKEEQPTELTTAEEEELMDFSLDEEDELAEASSSPFESSAKGEIEPLDLSETELDLSFGDEEAGDQPFQIEAEESEEEADFRITDSVRFEMKHSEEISSVTPFEKQLDELSGEMFTAEESVPKEEFEPERPEPESETFQTVADDTTRLVILSKYFYQRAEAHRAKQTVGANVLAIFMYYTAIETVLKAAALKYESCNPAVASLKIILDSLEEETGNTITGKKSMLDNIVSLRDAVQLETSYPDDDACELAARISERFLVTFCDEFLSIDFTEFSSNLPNPREI